MAGGRASSGRPASRPGTALAERLAAGTPLLLDGATGTELERRGVPSALPLWSTHALLEAAEVVAAVHADYVDAGAEILTANTFRTQRRTLSHLQPAQQMRLEALSSTAKLSEPDEALTERAVALARRAAQRSTSTVWVAGSAPPLEDCYRPDLVPDEDALEREHLRHAENLARAGVDLVLVETMNTVREAVAVTRAARACGLPAIVSFVVGVDATLLGGEPLEDAIASVLPFEPLAVGVNCVTPSTVTRCLPTLATLASPFCVWANLGTPLDPPDPSGPPDRDRTDSCTPEEFAAHALGWIAAGARLVGGCCGTTPAHIRALAHAIAPCPSPAPPGREQGR